MNKRHMACLGSLVATGLGLGGCSLMPAYERPEAPIPAVWPGAQNPEDGTQTVPAWQPFFSHPELQGLIQTALEHNRDLRLAALALEQTRAQWGLRSADTVPNLNASLMGNRAPSVNGGLGSSYSAGVVINAYELDFFGRLASLKTQALAQYLASDAGRQNVQLGLVAAVAQHWLAWLSDTEQEQWARQLETNRAEALALVRLRVEQGLNPGPDLHQAELAWQMAQQARLQAQRQGALTLHALHLLLGTTKPQTTSGPRPRLAELAWAPLPAGLPSVWLTQRPDILQAEQQLRAAHANIGAARAAFFPRISLTTGVGSASKELSGLFSAGSWGATWRPEWVLPLFDGGRNQANLALAETARAQAVAQYEKTIQTAFKETADALDNRHSLGQQWQNQQAQQEQEKQRFKLQTLRHQHGLSSRLDWLESERAWLLSQQNALAIQAAYQQSQVSLYKALGGGGMPKHTPLPPA